MHFDMGLTKIKQIAGAHCRITNKFINIVRKNPLTQLRNLYQILTKNYCVWFCCYLVIEELPRYLVSFWIMKNK